MVQREKVTAYGQCMTGSLGFFKSLFRARRGERQLSRLVGDSKEYKRQSQAA